MNRRRLYAGVAVSLMGLLVACDMTDPESGAVLVRIAVAGMAGRTVAPNAALEDVTGWELWGGKLGAAETVLKGFSGAEGATVYLEPGTWHFTLKGSTEGGVVLAGTIPEQTIVFGGGTNVLDFTVAPVSEGQGTVAIVINLPEGSGINSVRVFKDEAELNPPVTPVGNRVVFEGTYAAGDYYFSFQLYKDSVLYGAVSEVVQVRANLESGKAYTLDREDLNLTYVITYHLMDEAQGTQTGSYRYTDLDVTLLWPARDGGYLFEGWYDNPDLSGDAVTAVPAGSLGNKDFYARWSFVPGSEYSEYIVTFNADGGQP